MKNASVVFLIVFLPSLLVAHRVNIFTQVEGDSVIGQCYYKDGTPVRQQKVEISKLSGGKLLELETDSAGYFRFAPPVKVDLKIVLYAGMGHQSETTIKAGDLPEVKKLRAEKPKSSHEVVEAAPQRSEFDKESMRRIVGEVVEEKFNALRELIVKQQRSTSLITIIGGIGYILGIFGLLSLLRSRKRQ
jgi:nickel transport protein